MALFKRGKRETPTDAPADEQQVAASDASEAAADEVVVSEPVPEVGISFSTFGKAAAPPSLSRPAPQAPAPRPTAGLPDNGLLRAALAALPEKPQNTDVMNIMRQALQGQLYLRVRGNAKQLIADGQELTLAVTAIEDKRFLLAFSGGAALQDSIRADGDTSTSAVGQPAMNVFRNVLAGPYAGMIIDPASPQARIVLPTPLIEKSVEEADPAFTIKSLLAIPRTDATTTKVAEALATVKLWVAAGPADDEGRFGLAESRSPSGERRLEVFSHPLEVIALGRGDRPVPLTGAQLASVLRGDDGITGVVVDPAGPWIALDREQLGPVLSLA